MKRVFIVDDERPVVEGVELMVGRDLGGEFEIVGSAASGREAVERYGEFGPDIVLMDVSMPGISGLEAIRELRRRGATAAFVLVTAYERFDIAREAVELGIRDYLLKPVSRETLARSLRSAAAWIDRIAESDGLAIETRERVDRLLPLAESALVEGVMLGLASRRGWQEALAALGLAEPFAAAVTVAFAPAASATTADAEAEVEGLHAKLREALRYRSRAFVGPVVSRCCLVLVPCRDLEDGRRKASELATLAASILGGPDGGAPVRIGTGSPRPWIDIGESWSEALRALVEPGSPAPTGGPGIGTDAQASPGLEVDEDILRALLEGDEARAYVLLESLIADLGPGRPSARKAGRLAVLLGHIPEVLARRGYLGEEAVAPLLDLSDLVLAQDPGALALAARSRLARLISSMGSEARHSPQVARVLAFVRENFHRAIGLETASNLVDLSPGRLSRLLVEETGRGFSDLLIERRIERAKELLMEPGASVKDVSLASGYPDPNYFARLFKKMTGHTPSGWAGVRMEKADE